MEKKITYVEANIMNHLSTTLEDGTTLNTYNWVSDDTVPKLTLITDGIVVAKKGVYSKFRKKAGAITQNASELYETVEDAKQEKFKNIFQDALQDRPNLNQLAFTIAVHKKNIPVLGYGGDWNNDNYAYTYLLGDKRSVFYDAEPISASREYLNCGVYYNNRNSEGKPYIANGFPNNVTFSRELGSMVGPYWNGIWSYFNSRQAEYPIIHSYCVDIETIIYTEKGSQLMHEICDNYAYSWEYGYSQVTETGATSFLKNDDLSYFKTIIDLYDVFQKSSSETERNYVKSFGGLGTAYLIKWLRDCLKKGKIIDDTEPTYDDRIDYYARIDNNETIVMEWVNKAVNSGQLVFGADSCIKILCDYTEYVEGTPIERAYMYKVPYSFGNFELNIKDLRDTLDVPLFPASPIKIRLQGNTVMENGETAERNILFFDVEIKTKDKNISDYGEYEANDVYSDTINIGEPPADDEPTEPTDPPTSDDPIDGGDVTTKNGLTTTYALTSANADSLGAFIWNNSNNWFDSLLKVQADALSNIVSCKLLPFSLSGTGKTIKIGNINTQVTALEVDNQVIRKSGGSLKLNRYFNNFLDYAPYTKISLYLPFIGFSQIENEYMYDGVSVEYLFDIITGEMLVLLKSNGKTFRTINGSFGIDIPFSSTNKTQIEGSFLSKIAKDMIDVNPIGLLDTYTDIATSRFKTSNSSSPSSVCAYSAPLQSFVTVDRPILNKPSSYNHDVGQKCVGSYYLRNLKGYTEVENIELNCPCTDSEKNEILSLLRSGVYL